MVRPGWVKVVGVAVAGFVVGFALLVLSSVLAAVLFGGQAELARLASRAIAATLALLGVRFVLGGPLRWDRVALRWAGSAPIVGVRLVQGTLIGVALVALPFLAAWALGLATVGLAPPEQAPGLATLIIVSATIAVGALFEEVAFRAAVTGVLVQRLAPIFAAGLSALPFALLHLNKPDATVLAAGNTVLAGFALGLVFLRSPTGLWLATGVHFGWNVTLEWLGVPHSGNPIPYRWLSVVPQNEWLFGGSYGLEAGLLSTLVWLGLAAWVLCRPAMAPRPQ
jgi:hypothetical protein